MEELVGRIVEELPNEKKFSIAREAKKENVTDKVREDAEKVLWEVVKERAGEAWDAVKDSVATAIITSAPKVAQGISKWLKRLN